MDSKNKITKKGYSPSSSKIIDLWNEVKSLKSLNKEEIKKIMKATGFTNTEIREMVGNLKDEHKSRIDELKEDLIIRHKIRTRLMFEHLQENNFLSTLSEMRNDEKHIIDMYSQLGEITPPSQGVAASFTGALRIEPLLFEAIKQEEQPQLPPSEEDKLEE